MTDKDNAKDRGGFGYPLLGEVEALRAENKRLRELLYAIADANSVATMQSSAKLFRKWYEEEKKKGFNLA